MRTLGLALIVLMGGCGEDSPMDPGPDGGTGADGGGADSSVADAPDAPGVDGAVDDAAPGPCPPEDICLQVVPAVPGQPTPDGRLTVIFYQLQKGGLFPPPQPVVAYDVPFSGTATDITIPRALITPPAPTEIDNYYFCPRTCGDLSNPVCDCPAAQAKAALAFVFVLVDDNGNGMVDPIEIDDPFLFGVGYLQIALSDADYPVPHALDQLFIEGIREGLEPYEVLDEVGTQWDDLGIPPAGTVFDLNVCVPGDPSCQDMPFPNLT